MSKQTTSLRENRTRIPHHDSVHDHGPTDSKVNSLLAGDGGGDGGLSALAAVDGDDVVVVSDIDALRNVHYVTVVYDLLDCEASSRTALVHLQVPRSDSCI